MDEVIMLNRTRDYKPELIFNFDETFIELGPNNNY